MIGTADPAVVVHVHVRPASSPAWRLALLFRDWLRADAGERDAYLAQKERLVAEGLRAADYAVAKEPWFTRAVVRAEAWAARTGWTVEEA
jgi:dephospho-CoA kinase